MKFNELTFYFKKYKMLSIVLYLQITLFFIIIGTFIAFVEELNYESKGLQQLYEGKAIYQLLDGYYDGEQYSDFVTRPGYLHRLKNYYNELDTSSDFRFISMFNNHILLKDNNKLPDEIIEGYEQGNKKHQVDINNTLFTAAKSFQMNKQAIDFFGLGVLEGRLWNENDFKDPEATMPVLLGSSYRNTFNVGEETTINYYGKIMPIKIIGFLKENSKVFFNNNPEFYLDRYLLLPYRIYGEPISETDEKFQQISYFAMVNGYVITDNNPLNIQNMMQRIEAIAKKTQFGNYSFIGLNPHFLKYKGLMTVLQENKVLVKTLYFSLLILNIFIISLVLVLQYKRRLSFFAIHYLMGETKWGLVKMLWIEILSILLAAYLTNFFVLNQLMKIGDMKLQFFLLILCVFFSIIICILPARTLLSNPFVDYIYTEDEGGK